jgi:hypothetical protein
LNFTSAFCTSLKFKSSCVVILSSGLACARIQLVHRRLASFSPRVVSYSYPSSSPSRIQVPYPVKRCTRVISLCPTSPKPQLVPGCTPSPRLCVGRQSPIRICCCLLAPATYDLINVYGDKDRPLSGGFCFFISPLPFKSLLGRIFLFFLLLYC